MEVKKVGECTRKSFYGVIVIKGSMLSPISTTNKFVKPAEAEGRPGDNPITIQRDDCLTCSQ